MRSVVWFGLIYLGIYVPALKRSLLEELMRIDSLGVWSKVHVQLDGLGDPTATYSSIPWRRNKVGFLRIAA